MNDDEKNLRRCRDAAPIPIKTRSGLPLPLRELADVLAELAMRQLSEPQPHETGEEN